jgi:hypothetical protein
MKAITVRTLRVVAALCAATAFALVLSVSDAAAAGLPKIDAGAYHTCAVQTDGTLTCWGDNAYGQSSPPAGTFTSVSSGFYHSCAVRTNGSVACWGWNGYGQTSPPAGTFKSVTAGYAHTCAVRADDAAVCWGGYGYGAFPPFGSFSDVASGNDFSCGVRTNGALTCWGYNHPDGNSLFHPSGTFASVEVGMWNSCAVRTDGSAACWGLNNSGQSTAPAGMFSSVTTGGNVSCGVKADASLVCWGFIAPPPAGSFDSVTAGYIHACAVRTNGTIVCWGHNGNGQTNVPVTDSTPPTIASAITGTLGQNGWYTSDVSLAWSVIESESPDSLTKDGCLDVSITADQPGTTYSCSGSSVGGSAGPVEVTIKRDVTAPSLDCGSPAPAFLLGQAGGLVAASVSDATSGPTSASLSAAADTATVGAKSASLTGSDNAGNETTAACGYRVGYDFSGFFQPVDNGVLNVARAGRAIPLKWRLTDASGTPITNLSAAPISTVTLNCGTLSEGTDAIEEYAAGASGLQNLGDGYYQLNWKSPSTYAGSCRRLRLDLGEGAYRTADFQFTA